LLRFGGFTRNYGHVEGLMAALAGSDSFTRQAQQLPKNSKLKSGFSGIISESLRQHSSQV